MTGQDEIGSDQTQIIKGKRTKRQRSSSTFMVATTITSTSSSADEYNSSAVTSPIISTDCTEEEEDLAICLIMLARGNFPTPDLKNSTKLLQSDHQNSNFYVYECKTCNRTFSSFQALGGHRASHKKPKSPLKSSGVEEGQNGNTTKVSGSALASNTSNNISKGNKVHECSICGSEFSSGQALGGHMRRHRTATTASPGPGANSEVEKLQSKYLPLDLNLPAPEESSKFEGIVFSATPALVDCHY